MKQNKLKEETNYTFYDTHFTRNDVINLIKLEQNSEEFSAYIDKNILSTWNTNQASPSRNAVFCNFLQQLYIFMDTQNYSIEQKSTIMSIAYYIFIESLEKKMTQIDSYDLIKDVLKAQTKITNCNYLPMFNQEQIETVKQFFKDTFYRYYSLYEITMTKFIDLNIYSHYKFDDKFPRVKKLDQHVQCDPNQIKILHNYIMNERKEEEEEDQGQDEQNYNQEEEDLEQEQINLQLTASKVELNEEDKKIDEYVGLKVGEVIQNFKDTLKSRDDAVQQNVETILNPKKK